jgi:hypothetical protein
MSPPSIAFIVFGLACIALGVAHELTWLRRRGGVVVKGVIVEIIMDPSPSEGGPYYHPKIEYSIGEEAHDFVSEYGTRAPDGMLAKGFVTSASFAALLACRLMGSFSSPKRPLCWRKGGSTWVWHSLETLDGQQAGLPKAAAGFRSPCHAISGTGTA